MRVAVDARPLTHPHTGIGRYTKEITSRLQKAGVDIRLYSHRPFKLHDAQLSSDRSGDVYPAFGSLFAQWRFPEWARLDDSDVFWSPRHHLPLLSDLPCVVTIHDLVWKHAPKSMTTLGRTLETLLMPRSLRKATAVIAISDATKSDLLSYMPTLAGKLEVIHAAAFASRVAVCDQQARGRCMLFVGTFEPRKNVTGILRAYAKLRAAGTTNRRLQLAGRTGWKQDISSDLRELSLSDHVDIIEPESQQHLEALYAACDFLLMPSLYEGFGLPILEAMSFGKPVITSNVSSMPEVAGDAALLVDPYSVDDISDAMRRLITDEALYATLAARARPQAAKFSWDRAAEETLTVLEAAAARGRPQR